MPNPPIDTGSAAVSTNGKRRVEKVPGRQLAERFRFPNSRKVFVSGELHPDIRVPMREIALSPTRIGNKLEENPALKVYDTSGPYTDPEAIIDIHAGLERIRAKWILNREPLPLSGGGLVPPKGEGAGDGGYTAFRKPTYEEVDSSYKPVPGHSDANLPLPPRRKALRGTGDVTQLQLARAGIITAEMEYIAIRE